VVDARSSDAEVRRFIYDQVLKGGAVPTRAAIASATGASLAESALSLERLAAAHVVVLGRDGEVLMANPFSAVPTPFAVSARGHAWYGNCIWDAMGIAAMLRTEALIEASCGCCGTAMALRVPEDCKRDERVAHFAIPAAHFWDDIVFN
jgi:hypothetical protein